MKFIHQVEPYITEHDIKAVEKYLRSGGWLTEFEKTREFEDSIARFVGAKHAVCVPSGTVALYLALLSLGIGKGDKVVVPDYTMIATVNAVKWAGAEPVIVDVERPSLCMDMERIKIDPSCKAVMYVSINGRCGNMTRVAEFCRKKGLFLIEDACQALGSKCGSRYLGTFGDIGVFSFTPHKIITTGQGGMLVTASDKIYKKSKKIKDFCRTSAGCDEHDGIGYNFKFTDLQAVIGIEEMRDINYRAEKKRKLFRQYQDRLEGIEEIEFLSTNLAETVPWFADVILPSEKVRNALMDYLKEKNIGTRIFYPPINHQKPYSHYPRGSFPVAEDVAQRGAWLPSSMGLKEGEIDYISGEIRNFFVKHNE